MNDKQQPAPPPTHTLRDCQRAGHYHIDYFGHPAKRLCHCPLNTDNRWVCAISLRADLLQRVPDEKRLTDLVSVTERLRAMRQSSLWNADGYDGALSALIEELETGKETT